MDSPDNTGDLQLIENLEYLVPNFIRRIFATLHEPGGTANMKLSETDQPVFCSFDKNVVYRVPNKWGLKGWTTFELKKVPNELMLDAMDTAYKEALKSKSKKK